MAVAKSYAMELERIKKNINNAYTYFYDNYERYHLFRRYCFESTLTDSQRSILDGQGKPSIECNVVEARVSRLLGEFSKQEPSIQVCAGDGVNYNPEMLEFLEGHLRHILYEANKNSCTYEVYRDILSGGFSVVRVSTKYASTMSFDQVLDVRRVFDPTLCGFDPLARHPHKGDGKFSFECYPMLKEDFDEQYSKSKSDDLSYTRRRDAANPTRNIGKFTWSYEYRNEKIVMMAEYFEKKKKNVKIVRLSNNRVLTEKKYEELSEIWNQEGYLEQIPVVIGKPSMREIDQICRFRLIENEVIDYKETDFTYLPHVFFDGNSILLRNSSGSQTTQYTRPYIYQARGEQDLLNYNLQCLGNFYENMCTTKFIIKKEAIPQEKEYLEGVTEPQSATTIVVNAYSENNPDKPIQDPIREVIPTNAPQEVLAGFPIIQGLLEQSLGSFDSAIGRNDADLSGIAMIESITQSNAAAMPFVNHYLQSLQHVALICVDLIPKYKVTPTTIPIVGIDGERSFKPINQNGNRTFDYDSSSLSVNIKAGVNFQIEKNRALMQILAMMKASPEFNSFMNDVGLKVLVKNMTVYGTDELLSLIPTWEKKKEEMQKQQQQAQQQMLQNDPRIMDAKTKQMKVMQEAKQNEIDNQIKIAEVAIDKQRADNESIEMQHIATQEEVNSSIQREKAQAEVISHSLDNAAKMATIKHQERMDHHENHRKTAELHHKMDMEKKSFDSKKETESQKE